MGRLPQLGHILLLHYLIPNELTGVMWGGEVRRAMSFNHPYGRQTSGIAAAFHGHFPAQKKQPIVQGLVAKPLSPAYR
jgi:hypothetical protein